MGLTDYISRNPFGAARPISMYDEDFVIAQIDAKVKLVNVIRQRGRPRKFPTLELHDNSKTSNTTTVTKRPRAARENYPCNCGTIPKSMFLEHKVIRKNKRTSKTT